MSCQISTLPNIYARKMRNGGGYCISYGDPDHHRDHVLPTELRLVSTKAMRLPGTSKIIGLARGIYGAGVFMESYQIRVDGLPTFSYAVTRTLIVYFPTHSETASKKYTEDVRAATMKLPPAICWLHFK